MEEELKPCPICEGASQISEWRDLDGDWFFSVLCPVCEIEIKQKTSSREAIAAWNALPRHLKWTKEKPTQDGWYWFRHKAFNTYIAKVNCGGTILFGQYFNLKDINNDAEWAGPILEPEES